MSDTLIEIKNISKTINKYEILRNINLDIKIGNIYGIVGRNGSGKSVLLKVICGLLSPTSGEILFEGLRMKKGDFIKDIGILIDSPGMLNQYSAIKNLEFLAAINNKITTEDIKEVLTLVGLNPNNDQYVKNYSLGMKQKLGIAQAIMEKPSFIILDEPMNALDDYSIEKMRALILSLKKEGRTIILTSHNKEDINLLCDEVYKIEKGKLKSIKI